MSNIDTQMNQLLILDRDGVINKSPTFPERYILDRKQLIVIKKTIELIVSAQFNNWNICVVTNQQCIAKGLISYEEVMLMHKEINQKITDSGGTELVFYVCPHAEDEKCKCRKPEPGLLLSAMKDDNSQPNRTIFIGDNDYDQLAANNAGIRFKMFDSNFNYATALL